jgi:hypothetical protein
VCTTNPHPTPPAHNTAVIINAGFFARKRREADEKHSQKQKNRVAHASNHADANTQAGVDAKPSQFYDDDIGKNMISVELSRTEAEKEPSSLCCFRRK